MSWLLVLISIVPQEGGVIDESVDVIEANSYYDETGRLVFDQVIFWDWSRSQERYEVRDWRLIRCCPGYAHWPERDFWRGGWTCTWYDRNDAPRRVFAPSLRRTWTQWDPELVDRKYLPKERRRELITLTP